MKIEEINLIKLKEQYPEVAIGRSMNVTNQTFGKLIPLYRTLNKGKQTFWVCYCTCGNPKGIRPYDMGSVRAGRSQSCGCLAQDNIKKRDEDIVGTIINGWKIIEALPYDGAHKYFKCECVCDHHTALKEAIAIADRALTD